MTTSIAEYYLDELYDWKSAVDLYLTKVDDSEEWLRSLQDSDSVPELAAKTEHYLNQLFLSKENLSSVRSAIQSSERKLYKEQAPVSNDAVTENLKIQQRKLRQDMHRVEKDYLDVKYECDEFLANAVDIQNNIGISK